ncbi:MAG: TetR/AcrR family transcriptional regulator [Patescibacteria group bacterium]
MSVSQQRDDQPPGKRVLAKQATKTRIRTVARKLFTERGYGGAAISRIAGAAGISTKTVSSNFFDKEDLLFAVIGKEHEAYHAAFRKGGRAAPLHEKIVNALAIDYEPRRRSLVVAEMEHSWASKESGHCVRMNCLRDLLKTEAFRRSKPSVFDAFFLMVWGAHVELCRPDGFGRKMSEAGRRAHVERVVKIALAAIE